MVAGDQAIALPGHRARTVLAVLLARANQWTSSDVLIDSVWGESPPATAGKALGVHVSHLRRALGEGGRAIVTVPGGYLIDLHEHELDALVFEAQAARGRTQLAAGSLGPAAESFSAALRLWRGSAYADFVYEEFAQSEILRLEELRLATIEDHIHAQLGLGPPPAELVTTLRVLSLEHPLRERLWAQLMTALYRSGRKTEAMMAYQQAVRVLGEELAFAPGPALSRLAEQIRLNQLEIPAPTPERHNLPLHLDRFVGRGDQLDRVEKLVQNHRLVTLKGVGGIGKTRLALEVARRFLGLRADGVWLVPLASLILPQLLPLQLATALSLDGADRERLVGALAEWSALVVFDNCEHQRDAVAEFVEELLQRCPHLSVLATSREPLAVPGEVVVDVPPLGLPAPSGDADESEAVQLFLDRTGHRRLELSGEDLQAVAEICRSVDGIPLAIELIAARLQTTTLAEIAARLDDQLALARVRGGSRPARQLSMEAAMEWSYRLLDRPSRRSFKRLSIFHGSGFTRDMAVAVLGEETDRVDDALARLVEASLLVFDTGSPGRYRMLRIVRQFGQRRLEASGQADEVRRRHAVHFLGAVQPHLAPQAERMAVLERERGNLRVALAWAVASDQDMAQSLVASLGDLWLWRGDYLEAGDWCQRVLSLPGGRLTVERTKCLYWSALVGLHAGSEEAPALAARLKEAAAASGDEVLVALPSLVEAQHTWQRGLLAGTARAAAAAVRRLHLSPELECEALGLLGWAELLRGHFARVEDVIERMQAAAARTDQPPERLQADNLSAGLEWWRGDLRTAEGSLGRVVATGRTVGAPGVVLRSQLELLALLIGTERIDKAAEGLRRLDLLRPVAGAVELAEAHILAGRVRLRCQESGADAILAEGLEGAVSGHNRIVIVKAIRALAELALTTGDPAGAAALLGAEERMRMRSSMVWPGLEQRLLEADRLAIRELLGPVGFQQAWRRGLAMSLAGVVGLARSRLASSAAGMGPSVG